MRIFILFVNIVLPIMGLSIYKDIFTDDEILSSVWKMELVNETVYEVHGKLVRRKRGDLIYHDFCPANQRLSSCTKSDFDTKETGVDVILQNNLIEYNLFKNDSKSFTKYFDSYVDRLEWKIKRPYSTEECQYGVTDVGLKNVKVFKNNIHKVKEYILTRFDNFKFFVSQNKSNYVGMVVASEFRSINAQIVPVIIYFKHGLKEVKIF